MRCRFFWNLFRAGFSGLPAQVFYFRKKRAKKFRPVGPGKAREIFFTGSGFFNRFFPKTGSLFFQEILAREKFKKKFTGRSGSGHTIPDPPAREPAVPGTGDPGITPRLAI